MSRATAKRPVLHTQNGTDRGPELATYVRLVGELSSGDVELAGGKGANLGELTRLGVPVPAAFVIAPIAYEAMRDGDELLVLFKEHLDGLDVTDTSALRFASDAVIEMVRQSKLPDDVHDALRDVYARLTDKNEAMAVIVRSSATLEDTAQASFVGMNRTLANVHGLDMLVEAVKGCWASLFSPRSIFYRASNQFPVAEATIAVVVQSYVPATAAGVMFTVDPATGSADHLVIEATVGSGESLVSGRLTPDRYIINAETSTIESRAIARKELRTEDLSEGGTVERTLEASEGAKPALDDTQAITIARLGLTIAEHYRHPQDIEWVIDPDGAVWIVRSRPVTAWGGTAIPTSAASKDAATT